MGPSLACAIIVSLLVHAHAQDCAALQPSRGAVWNPCASLPGETPLRWIHSLGEWRCDTVSSSNEECSTFKALTNENVLLKDATQGSCDDGWTYTLLSSSTVTATNAHALIETETSKCTCTDSTCPAQGEVAASVSYHFNGIVPTANDADYAAKKDGTIDKMAHLFAEYQAARKNDMQSGERAVEAARDRKKSLGEAIKSKFWSGDDTWSWNSGANQASKDWHSAFSPCFSQCWQGSSSTTEVTTSSSWTASRVDDKYNAECADKMCDDWSLASECSLVTGADSSINAEIEQALADNWSDVCPSAVQLQVSKAKNRWGNNPDDVEKKKKLSQMGINPSDIATYSDNEDSFYFLKERMSATSKLQQIYTFGFQMVECTDSSDGSKSLNGKVVAKKHFGAGYVEATICNGDVSYVEVDAYVRKIISNIRFNRMKEYLTPVFK